MYMRIVAAILIAVAFAATYWKGHTSGSKAVQIEWDADVAQRTAQALQASEAARKKEQELQTKVRSASDAYRTARESTNHVAIAAANGMRELEAIVAKSTLAGAAARNPSGDDGDPRLDIPAECSGALVRLDAEARKLADQVAALQAVSAIVRLK